jgi:hypothetical protein
MGAYNVIVLTYKKGLLKKLFDEEKRKQYLDSNIDDGNKYKDTQFCRGSGFNYYKHHSKFRSYDNENSDDESKYKYKTKTFKFHIKATEYTKSWKPTNENDYSYAGHRFVFYPELRKLHIEDVG